MKADFFAVDQEARAKLRAACDSWLGTPFRERSKVKGPLGGVDCVGFVACVFREIGAISEDLKVPAYVVFTDNTLIAIAESLPADEAALVAIPGIGARKREQFGPDVLELVRARQ